MLAKKIDLEDLKCELEMEEEIYIWLINPATGVRKLDIIRAAELLMRQYWFLTVGDKIKEIYYYQDGVYNSGGHDFIRERIQNYTRGIINNNQILEIIGQIERSTYFDRKNLEKTDPNLICFKNGIYNLKEDKLIPHTHEIIFINKIPHNYDPNSECKEIMKFLGEVLDEKDIVVLQEFVGYLMFRKYYFKKAAIFVGEPDTGKTTTIDLIVKLIGENNTSGESLHRIISDKFSAFNLYNKHLNFYDDLPFQDLKITGEFKVITGGGYVTGEKKFGDKFQFMNYAKLMYAANKISAIKDVDDEAYYGRWLIFFFNNTFNASDADTDPYKLEKITAPKELEGMIVWALKGLKRLLEKKSFNYYRTADENKKVMERNSNILAAFVQDCLEEKDDNVITKENLYEAYSFYVKSLGGSRISKEKFGRDIQILCTYIDSRRLTTGKNERRTAWGNVDFCQGNHSSLNIYKRFKSLYNMTKKEPSLVCQNNDQNQLKVTEETVKNGD
jgi:putative DNA primase/helicase